MIGNDDEVTILFGGRGEVFSIKDLDPEVLKQMFGLDFAPLSVKLEGTNKNVLLRNKDEFGGGEIQKNWIILKWIHKSNIVTSESSEMMAKYSNTCI